MQVEKLLESIRAGVKDLRLEFIKKYIRPRGLDKKVGQVYAEELEKLVDLRKDRYAHPPLTFYV